MDEQEIVGITELARAFRHAIDRCKSGLTYIAFRAFPRGSCGDTSEMLGRFLEHRGFAKWTYVDGMVDGQTHAWIEKDNLIVDITADQFSTEALPLESVIVTADRTWHQQFRNLRQRPIGAVEPLPSVAAEIEATYQAILKELDGG